MKVEKPSKIFYEPWVYIQNPHWSTSINTRKVGKWLLFLDVKEVDHVWELIHKYTIEGKLGISSKVSTNFPSKYGNKKVICVYTYDFTDKKDVIRVREELKTLGFIKPIPYKTDEATRKGIYNSPNEFEYII